jgi:hypothetical protein
VEGPWLAGGFPSATLATFARSLPVPLDAISASLHRPLRGTPRIAPGPRLPAHQTQEGVEAEGKLTPCGCIARRAMKRRTRVPYAPPLERLGENRKAVVI